MEIDTRRDAVSADNAAQLNEFMMKLAADVYELGAAVERGLEQGGTEPGRLLNAFAALLNIRVNQVAQTFEHSELSSEVLEALKGMRSSVTQLKFLDSEAIAEGLPVLQRSLWSRIAELGLAGRSLHIREYDGVLNRPDDALIDRLAEIAERLVVRPRTGCQDGFGRSVPATEFREWLAVPGARLFVLNEQGLDVGFFIVHSQRADLLPEEAAAAVRYEETHEVEPEQVGWLPIVGILPEARLHLGRRGIHAYKLLASAVAQSCHTLGLERLLGEVRIGDYENAARKSHRRLGFEETGLKSRHGRFEYELIALDPLQVSFLVNPHLLVEGLDSPNLLQASKSRLHSLETILAQWDWRDPATIGAAEVCAPNGDVRGLLETANSLWPGCDEIVCQELTDGVALVFRFAGIQWTIRQAVPNQDYWTCDFADDNYGVVSFREAFDQLTVVRRRAIGY